MLSLLAASACARSEAPPRWPVLPPTGNGVWFADGLESVQAQAQAESALSRGGFSWVLYPAARIERRGGRWVVVKLPPPPRPLLSVSVLPVVQGGGEAAAALSNPDAGARRLLGSTLVLAAKSVTDGAARFGRVAGVHLDVPFTAETAISYGGLLRRIRPRFPPGLFVTASLNFELPEARRGKLRAFASGADGLVAMIFGEDDRADPASADLLGRSWWAGYAPGAEGRWKGRRGEDHGRLPESFLARLSDDPRLEFRHDMAVEERAGLGYLFQARREFTIEGRDVAPGDEFAFRQPSLPDMIRQFGGDLAGRRFGRGRVFRLAGRSDSERIFTLAALNEILLGHGLVPDLRVSIGRGKNSVTVSAENRSPLASVLSRVANWIEVDLSRAGLRDVQPGGFDRYEISAAGGRRVSLGRAARVRFYETLVGPWEKIEPAVILTRGPVPPGCCRFRLHVLAAAGPEFATDWIDAASR